MDFSVSPQDSEIVARVMMIAGFITSVVVSRKFLFICIVVLLIVVSYQVIHVSNLESSHQKDSTMKDSISAPIEPKHIDDKNPSDTSTTQQIIIVYPVMSIDPSGLYKHDHQVDKPTNCKRSSKKSSKRTKPKPKTQKLSEDDLVNEFIRSITNQSDVDNLVSRMTEELSTNRGRIGQ